jgi:hypothetical protein
MKYEVRRVEIDPKELRKRGALENDVSTEITGDADIYFE